MIYRNPKCKTCKSREESNKKRGKPPLIRLTTHGPEPKPKTRATPDPHITEMPPGLAAYLRARRARLKKKLAIRKRGKSIMATVTVNTLEFVSALRALIPVSKQATLYSGEKERNAATIAARITPAKKLALITGNSALGAVASVRIEQAVEAGEREFCLYTDDAKNITSIFKPNKQNSEEPLRLEFGDQLDNENIMIAETHKAYGNTELLIGNLTEDAEITDTLLNDLYLSVNNPEAPESPSFNVIKVAAFTTASKIYGEVATRVTGSDAGRIRHLIYGTHLHGVIALDRGIEDSEVATLVSEARNTVLETMGNRA
jgi:hypothetical protein